MASCWASDSVVRAAAAGSSGEEGAGWASCGGACRWKQMGLLIAARRELLVQRAARKGAQEALLNAMACIAAGEGGSFAKGAAGIAESMRNRQPRDALQEQSKLVLETAERMGE